MKNIKNNQPISRMVQRVNGHIEPIAEPTSSPITEPTNNVHYYVNNELTNLLTNASTTQGVSDKLKIYTSIDNVICAEEYTAGLMTENNHIDTINHISDTYQRGIYVLAVEYVYLAIKKMIKNGVKSNDDAYIDLFNLYKKYWINGYSSNNYINDLIQLTYIDILESIPTNADVAEFVKNLSNNIMLNKPKNNYDLHRTFNILYYKDNPLKDYQYKIVNRVRSYYRSKGDLVERCESKTVNSVAIKYACNQLEKQRIVELIEQKELIDKINSVVENCTKTQRQVFELRIKKRYNYKQIAEKIGISPSSSANLFNKVVGRIRSNIDLTQYRCDSNYADIYSIGIQQVEEVLK